jgi:uncharacterized protein YegL
MAWGKWGKRARYDDWDSEDGYGSDWHANSAPADGVKPYQPYAGRSYYTYRPRYDMSSSLEARVTGLVRGLTGKDLKLAQAKGWETDEKFMYYNPDDLKDATDDEVLGRILHHMGRSLHCDAGEVKKKVKSAMHAKYKALIEALEDARADRQVQVRYPGAAYYAGEIWQHRVASENPSKASKDDRFKARYGKRGELLPQDAADAWGEVKKKVKSAMHAARYGKSDELLPQDAADALGFHKGMTWGEVAERVPEYRRMFDAGRVGSLPVAKVAMEMEKRIADVPPNPSWEFCFAVACHQNGEPVDVGVFTDPKVLEGFRSAEQLIDGYLDCTTFSDALAWYERIRPYYPVPDDQEEMEMEGAGQQGGGMTDDEKKAAAYRAAQAAESATSSGSVADMDDDRAGVRWLGSLEDGKRDVRKQMAEYERIAAKNRGTTMTLMYLVRSILKDNATQRYSRQHKRGKLDARSMYKLLATGNVRVFRQPRVVSKKRYTMAVLVDQSGSMDGSNSDYAVQAAVVLCEVFDTLGLPFEVIGFDNTAMVYKRFGGAYRREYMPSLSCSRGGTDDENALRTVRDHLDSFDPSTRNPRGVFVISDGEGNDPRKMKELVRDMESKNAQVFGIGIGGVDKQALARSYEHYVQVDDVAGLPAVLAGLLRSQFRRRG